MPTPRLRTAWFTLALTTTVTMTHTLAQAPPTAPRRPTTLTAHGHERVDDYYWLNDRTNPEVISYLEAENRYTESALAPQAELRERLFDEIVARIKPDDESVPYLDRGYLYYERYEPAREHPLYLRRAGGPEGPEEVLLDVNALAEPHAYYNVATRAISDDNRLLVYAEDTLSRRIYRLRFKDLTTGATLPDIIDNTAGNVVWAADNRTVFYTRKDESLRPHKVFRHVIGTPVESDVEVYHEHDDTFYTYLARTKGRNYLTISSAATLTSEVRFLRADDPTGDFEVFEPRDRDAKHEYTIDEDGERWYIRTNADAENFKLATTPFGKTHRAAWSDLVPGRPEALVEGFELFAGYLVLGERVGGIVRQRIVPLATATAGAPAPADHVVDFGEAAYYSGTGTNAGLDTRTVRLVFTSLTTPVTTYDYDVDTRVLTMLKRQEVVGDFDPAAYVSERIDFPARDGKRVPLSVVRHRDTPLDGTSPLLLYGYGSYGYSLDPTFSSVRLSLLDRGFVYVIAHVRGGEELGRQWYEDGKLLQKKNTFTDFIDAGRWLVANRYTAPDELYAMGGSAGGLLVGAVANMAPELWAGIVAAVPFVDVVTTMLDESIPLTTGEYDEWGNPNDEAYYRYMLSYSPYDQVSRQAYPPLLVVTGLHDSQVQYWEPAKWVARLRTLKTDERPLLLYTDMSSGHGGASGRFARYRDTALEYAWLLGLAGRADTSEVESD